MSDVLITGGAGFIGKRLALALNALGINVRILDNLSPQIHGQVPEDIDWLKIPGIDFIRGSVTNGSDVNSAIEGVKCIIHLAAETGTGQSMYEIEKYNFVNIYGTSVLLNSIANTNNKVRRIILSSSRSVYGEGAYLCKTCNDQKVRYPSARLYKQLHEKKWDHICEVCNNTLEVIATSELDKVQPASIYAATKYAQEDLVRIYCQSAEIDYAIMRFQNVYGEGQSLKNPYTGILSIFSTRIRRGKQISVFEDGLESRDFVHVDDVVDALISAVNHHGMISDTFNVGSGTNTSVLRVTELLMKSLNGTSNIVVTGEYRLGDIRHNFASVEKIRSIFGVSPKISIEDGLQKFSQWVLTKSLPEDTLDSANSELKKRNLMG